MILLALILAAPTLIALLFVCACNRVARRGEREELRDLHRRGLR